MCEIGVQRNIPNVCPCLYDNNGKTEERYTEIMKKEYINLLVNFQKRKNSKTYKLLSLSIGIAFFLIVLPAIFIYIGFQIDQYLHIEGNDMIRIIISLLTMIIGLSVLYWSAYTQLKIGNGTPAPNAPTQQLIISGPYKSHSKSKCGTNVFLFIGGCRFSEKNFLNNQHTIYQYYIFNIRF